MNDKSAYSNDDIIVRKVTLEDNFEDIAELIYETDDYIYPYWFHDNVEECKKVLPPLMKEDGFFFNYESLYVAVDKMTNKIVGFSCIILPDRNLDYDYTELRNVDETYAFTIDNYIMELIKEVKELQLPYISNLAVNKDYRGRKIGASIFRHIIDENEKIYKKLLLDVLSNNLNAIKLYQNLGFEINSPEIMGIGYGPNDFVGQYSMERDSEKNSIKK